MGSKFSVGVCAGFMMVSTALAADTEAPLSPLHHGYAFDHPRLLVQQRLFGFAHGVRLLATACNEDAEQREAAASAYAAWSEQQAAAIESAQADLARHYFDTRAEQASWFDIVRALGLRDKLSADTQTLQTACATLGEALQKPRYDLQNQYRLQFLASRLRQATATEAEAEGCRVALAQDEADELQNSLTLWRTSYAAGVTQAQTTLEQDWPASQLEGTLDDWLRQAREQGRRLTNTERCKTLAARLLTNKSDPDDPFKPQP